jgi:hypothetical protein
VRRQVAGAASTKGCGVGRCLTTSGTDECSDFEDRARAPLGPFVGVADDPKKLVRRWPYDHGVRSRALCSTPPPFLVRAPDAAGAPPRNWCGAEELVRRRGSGAPAALVVDTRPGARRAGPFPHPLLDAAPFARTRTVCTWCAAEEPVRRRGSGSPPRNWCSSGLGSDTQATHRDRSRTTCSTTHPLLVLAQDGAGAPPRNWCGAEELVRRRGTGAPPRNWCGADEVRQKACAVEETCGADGVA